MSISKTAAQEKLGTKIAAAKRDSRAIYERLLAEVPEDSLVRTQTLAFEPAVGLAPGSVAVEMVKADGTRSRIHNHARDHILSQTGGILDARSADAMLVLTRAAKHVDRSERVLVREVTPYVPKAMTTALNVKPVQIREARAVLSDKYRRLDSAPIIETVMEVASRHGAVFAGGKVYDTRWQLTMLHTELFDAGDELLALGFAISHSDFGDGALSLKMWTERLACLNGAIREELLRQVHLGRKLSEDVEYSAETYKLDTAATVSAVRDIAMMALSKDRIAAEIEVVRNAKKVHIDAQAALGSFQRRGLLSKAETKRAAELWNTADIERLPAGSTAWRLSNVFSALANDDASQRRSLDFAALAGDVLTMKLPTVAKAPASRLDTIVVDAVLDDSGPHVMPTPTRGRGSRGGGVRVEQA